MRRCSRNHQQHVDGAPCRRRPGAPLLPARRRHRFLRPGRRPGALRVLTRRGPTFAPIMTPAELLTLLSAHPLVRRIGWFAFLSWVTALTLTGYLFGFTDGFFGRWLSATVVLWLLLTGTALGIVPFIKWLTQRLSDGSPARAPRGRRPAAAKRPGGRTAGPGPTQIPANKWR